MSNTNLSDTEAKARLLGWPGRTRVWPPPEGVGFWLRAQPTGGGSKGPRISSPGARLFHTQPDGLWVYFSSRESCDLVAIEVCGSVQNLNDKRSRYIPASHSLVLNCGREWLLAEVAVQRGGQRPRWRATGSLDGPEPSTDLVVPVRFLRVMYALPNVIYHKWCRDHTPTGYEFFSPHSSLATYNSQPMQRFLKQMSSAAQFRVRIQRD